MRRRSSERGEGKGGCIFGLIFLLSVIFIAYKVVPVKIAAAELKQVIFDEAKSAGQQNDKQIRATIMAKATQLGLPLESANLIIARERQSIRVEATYTVPIAFPGYTHQSNYHHKAENPIF